MQLYIIRHTQVDVPKGTCYGHTDVPLADTFVQESYAVLQKVMGLQFDKVYSSPLTRCKKLAQTICPNQDIIYDDRLKELYFGDWEYKNWNDIEQTPEADIWFTDYTHLPTPNGESYVDLMVRTKSFLDDLKDISETSKVLVVTHGGLVRAIHTIIKKTDISNAFDLDVNYGELIKLDC